MAVAKKTEEVTTLDTDVTKPSVTAPGDGPADTTDPTEIAVSVPASPGKEALKVGTVNAVVPVEAPAAAEVSDPRIETYEAVKPDGTKLTIEHNLETGETKVK